jgi:hypothetical protein
MMKARSTRLRAVLAALCVFTFGCTATVNDDDLVPPPPEEKSSSWVMYLPNRLCDVLDIVRLRGRVGPGWTLSARATELLDVNLGGHGTLFVGLPGPRGKPRVPWPIGLEAFAGAEVSIIDGTQEEDEHAPHYGIAEVGLGFQFLLIGLDIGIEPFEAVDFVVGLLAFDPIEDDF